VARRPVGSDILLKKLTLNWLPADYVGNPCHRRVVMLPVRLRDKKKTPVASFFYINTSIYNFLLNNDFIDDLSDPSSHLLLKGDVASA
jgi:hypothetical protein